MSSHNLEFLASHIPHTIFKAKALRDLVDWFSHQDHIHFLTILPLQASLKPITTPTSCHTCIKYTHWTNRWIFVSSFYLHKEHILGTFQLILYKMSHIKALSIRTICMNLWVFKGHLNVDIKLHHHTGAHVRLHITPYNQASRNNNLL